LLGVISETHSESFLSLTWLNVNHFKIWVNELMMFINIVISISHHSYWKWDWFDWRTRSCSCGCTDFCNHSSNDLFRSICCN
jgi:hypothetical protein